MKEIKVKQIFGTHQIYQEIVNNPPRGVKYQNVGKSTSQGKYYEKKKLKEFIGVVLNKIKIPRMMLVRPGDYDLIHSSRGIIPLTTKPWVMDIEHVHSFFGLNPNMLKSKMRKKLIERILKAKNCKAILCHCEATRQAFFHYLDCTDFKEKIQVLYPSSHLIPIERKKKKKIRILSVLSLFHIKAGKEVLEVFARLEKKYNNIELYIKSDVPVEIKKQYTSKNIHYIPYFQDIIPREELLQTLYAQSDIFLYPTLCDSFGYSLIDALVAKLPIVGTNLFAIPEVVEHKKNGMIIDIPGYNLKDGYVQEHFIEKLSKKEYEQFMKNMYKALEELIKDKELRENMSQASYQKIRDGKFSIQTRNKQLKKIYDKALQ